MCPILPAPAVKPRVASPAMAAACSSRRNNGPFLCKAGDRPGCARRIGDSRTGIETCRAISVRSLSGNRVRRPKDACNRKYPSISPSGKSSETIRRITDTTQGQSSRNSLAACPGTSSISQQFTNSRPRIGYRHTGKCTLAFRQNGLEAEITIGF
jgi:hypothetical protein